MPDIARPEKLTPEVAQVPKATTPAEGSDRKPAEEGVETLVQKLLAAVEQEDGVATELLRRRLVSKGDEAVEPLLAAMHQPVFPIVLVDVLESIAQRRFGLDVKTWERWWREKRR